MNTFGKNFTLTTFGESHGPAIGGVVDGMPAGIDIDLDFIQSELNRRRPGQSKITTSRQEADRVELLSGVFEGKSTGCPIGFIVRNENHHSQDYENMRTLFRPSHADFTYYSRRTPPNRSDFSQRMTLWPRSAAVRAACMPPMPPPATSTVFFSFTSGMARYSSSWPVSGLMAQ